MKRVFFTVSGVLLDPEAGSKDRFCARPSFTAPAVFFDDAKSPKNSRAEGAREAWLLVTDEGVLFLLLAGVVFAEV